MQNGALNTRTENQKQYIKKQNYNTESAANFEHKCAPVRRIHVSFACNQQLANCRATVQGSEMQSGPLATRTENQKQISKTQLQHRISRKF
jgi:hypothetical protein